MTLRFKLITIMCAFRVFYLAFQSLALLDSQLILVDIYMHK